MTGIERIAAERQRQIDKEGWDAQHDAQHYDGSLVRAAVCYAAAAVSMPIKQVKSVLPGGITYKDHWPWEKSWDKRGKHTPMRMLVIAGALIAAEIDRRIAVSHRLARGEDE